ncbi:MAG: geranylgeranylglycerol-phosphate geranylgeranyltransferase [Candidatus Bathyarchaeota archaeon]|nr:geranylgeranylglycerol-phosphate geranylgeranyltransferase [Candidatus Bathyarchaeota archaeon]
MRNLDKAIGLIRLIRPVNCIMMGIAVVVGAVLAENEVIFQQVRNLTLGFWTGFFLTGSTMAINDFCDREIDAVNEPNRPIPSGSVKPLEAVFSGLIMAVIGFVTSLITNWKCLLVSSAAWALFVLYTTKGKRMGFIGNLMVSACISVPFIYGSFVVNRIFLPTSSIFVAIVFLSNTGREIVKGIVDLHGDERSKINTIAVRFGAEKAAVVSAIFYFAAIAITPLPKLLGIVSFWFLPLVILTDIGLASTAIMILSNPSRDTARKTKNQNLLWFSIGLFAFMTGILL